MCEVADVFTEMNTYHKSQFLDYEGSCVRRDLNYDGTYYDGRSSNFMTGRKHSFPNNPATIASDFAECQYQTVEWDWYNTEYVKNVNTSQEVLQSSGCMDASDLDICNVASTSTFGLSTIDGWDNFNSERVKGQICSSNSILYDVDENHDGLIDWSNAHPDTSWAFFGFQQSGIYRSWPAIYQCRTEQQCSGCSDPRYRGWYASAASGPKDVVIVIDTSGSMQSNNRIARAKEAASWVVNTLTSSDYASVVRFSTSASTWSSTLMPMTAENKASMKRWINELSAFGTTNMERAMDLTFDILEASSSVSSSNCQDNRNIVFMTDGDQTDGDVLSHTTSRNGGLTYDSQTNLDSFDSVGIARVHAFAVGDYANTVVTKSLACQNAGLYRQIPDADAANIMKEAIASYYLMSAASLVSSAGVGEVGARWTDVYEDGQGLGAMFAVCSAMYDYSLEPMDFFGVVCIGISMSTWNALPGANNEHDDIVSTQANCPDFTLDWTEMETFRERSSCESSCSNSEYVYCADYCGSDGDCGGSGSDGGGSASSTGLIIGIVIAVSVVVILLVVFLIMKSTCCDGGSQTNKAQPVASAPPRPTVPVVYAQAVGAPPAYAKDVQPY